MGVNANVERLMCLGHIAQQRVIGTRWAWMEGQVKNSTSTCHNHSCSNKIFLTSNYVQTHTYNYIYIYIYRSFFIYIFSCVTVRLLWHKSFQILGKSIIIHVSFKFPWYTSQAFVHSTKYFITPYHGFQPEAKDHRGCEQGFHCTEVVKIRFAHVENQNTFTGLSKVCERTTCI